MYEKTYIDRSIVDQANTTSPLPVLRHYYGSDVKETSGGRSISVKKVLRADKKGDGKWVSCRWHGEGIGDNIKLMAFCGGLSFEDAVKTLTGQVPFVKGERIPEVRSRRISGLSRDTSMSGPYFAMPRFVKDPTEGRRYLESRGLSLDVIKDCEARKILGYDENGVCFLGRNAFGTIKYAAHRFYREMPIPDDSGDTRNKKDATGSQKVYCFNIVPTNPDRDFNAYIVEGGINAMAQYDICCQRGESNVLILTTGGVAAFDWVSNPTTFPLLKKAISVIMIGEWEEKGEFQSKEKKQEDTDRSRRKILERLKEEKGVDAKLLYPALGYGDLADMHKLNMTELQDKQDEEKISELMNTPAIEAPLRRPRGIIRKVCLPPKRGPYPEF